MSDLIEMLGHIAIEGSLILLLSCVLAYVVGKVID
jgi:hypothetical protein